MNSLLSTFDMWYLTLEVHGTLAKFASGSASTSTSSVYDPSSTSPTYAFGQRQSAFCQPALGPFDQRLHLLASQQLNRQRYQLASHPPLDSQSSVSYQTAQPTSIVRQTSVIRPGTRAPRLQEAGSVPLAEGRSEGGFTAFASQPTGISTNNVTTPSTSAFGTPATPTSTFGNPAPTPSAFGNNTQRYSAHHAVVSNLHSGKYQQQRLYQPFTSSNPSPFGPNLNIQSKTRSLNPSLHLCLFGLDSFLSARLPPPSLHIYVLQFQGQAGEIVYYQLLPLPIGGRRRRSSSSGPRYRR